MPTPTNNKTGDTTYYTEGEIKVRMNGIMDCLNDSNLGLSTEQFDKLIRDIGAWFVMVHTRMVATHAAPSGESEAVKDNEIQRLKDLLRDEICGNGDGKYNIYQWDQFKKKHKL